jgi:hypothetical protein
MFAGAQAVDQDVEIGVRQGGMGAAKRGHDLDTDRLEGREAVAAPAWVATLESHGIRSR